MGVLFFGCLSCLQCPIPIPLAVAPPFGDLRFSLQLCPKCWHKATLISVCLQFPRRPACRGSSDLGGGGSTRQQRFSETQEGAAPNPDHTPDAVAMRKEGLDGLPRKEPGDPGSNNGAQDWPSLKAGQGLVCRAVAGGGNLQRGLFRLGARGVSSPMRSAGKAQVFQRVLCLRKIRQCPKMHFNHLFSQPANSQATKLFCRVSSRGQLLAPKFQIIHFATFGRRH